jgi:uncharacterized heparinase superfamily protein
MKIAYRELNNQILNDGGNYELSPMYHCIFLKDSLDILNILKSFDFETKEAKEAKKNLIKLIEVKIPKMINWINIMTFDKSKVTNFNDSASNIGPSPQDLMSYASKLDFNLDNISSDKKIGFQHLKDSGYISVQREDIKMIIDVAKLGPDYLLAHGHADTLSFELSKQNKNIFVNSGTSCYGVSNRRLFERSSRAHNTVEVNNASSSQVWSSFRVANRAYPRNLKINENKDHLTIECSHDGYRKILNRNLIHTRLWEMNKGRIVIKDEIKGKYKSAVARFIVDPNVLIENRDDKKFIIKNNDVEIEFIIKVGTVNLVNWESTNNFGFLESTKCFEIGLIKGTSIVEII